MTEAYWADDRVTLHLGDCLTVLPTLEAASVDAVVTDPPAGIAFMGREWDDFRRARNPADVGRGDVSGHTSARGPEYGHGERGAFVEWLTAVLAEAMRVMKPGAHALVWSIPRTSHWTAWAIEDAGLEIRDCVTHLFGSGFPKSLDVSKAIDRAAGAAREVVGTRPQFPDGTRGARARPNASPEVYGDRLGLPGEIPVTAPATENAARWDGWGTALKPGHEMWWLARKPLRGTVAANVVEHGTGAVNVGGCRVGSPQDKRAAGTRTYAAGRLAGGTDGAGAVQPAPHDGMGRWPPNVLLGPEAAEELDRQSGKLKSSGVYSAVDHGPNGNPRATSFPGAGTPGSMYADSGGASRFFPVFRYEPKAGSAERPRIKNTVLRLRADLTEDERAYVMAELRKAGVDAA
jgi:site-specific DNA-methyltransferase (adenine-specific)